MAGCALYGESGVGVAADQVAPVAFAPGDLPRVREFVLGHSHSAFRAEDGQRYALGLSGQGQLGYVPLRLATAVPVPVLSPDGWAITAVALGREHSAFVAGGRCFTFSRNAQGELGLGHLVPLHTPQLLPAPNGAAVTEVVAGDAHTAFRAGPTWYVFGANAAWQLGLGAAAAFVAEPRAPAAPGGGAIAAGAHTVRPWLTGTATCSGPTTSGSWARPRHRPGRPAAPGAAGQGRGDGGGGGFALGGAGGGRVVRLWGERARAWLPSTGFVAIYRIYRICGHLPDLWPSSGFIAIERICGHLPDLLPSAELVALYRICDHLPDLWPSTGFVAIYRIRYHPLDEWPFTGSTAFVAMYRICGHLPDLLPSTVSMAIYRICGNLPDLWPSTGFVALCRICGPLPDLGPYTGFVALYRICGHLLDLLPSTGFMAIYRIYRISGHVPDLWPPTGFVATYRICGHLPDSSPSNGFVAIYRICCHQPNLLPSTGFVTICRICGHLPDLWPSTASVTIH